MLWLSALSIALAFSDLGVVLSLTGAVGASVLGYILPSTMYLKSFSEELRALLDALFGPHADYAEAAAQVYRRPMLLVAMFSIVFGALMLVLGVVTVFVPPSS